MSPIVRRVAAPPRIVIDRSFPCRLEELWELWTTKSGIESWWGPEGFSTEVRRLDVRPGGEFEYQLTAVDPELRRGMESAGMLVTSVVHGTYTAVEPMHRLAYATVIDFVPDASEYAVAVEVDFEPRNTGVRMRFVSDRMRTPLWTERALMGFTSQFDRLEKFLAAARGARAPRRSRAAAPPPPPRSEPGRV
ncbi:MAG: SRPBCC domain-containing protein [Thermoplasmata archaeon]|nr:SRPBCC domain-containing protein [Thermoplasmata archaeon]